MSNCSSELGSIIGMMCVPGVLLQPQSIETGWNSSFDPSNCILLAGLTWKLLVLRDW